MSDRSFINRSGVRLVERGWTSGDSRRAVLAIIHGYAEHSGRYEPHARYFCDLGIAVHSYDQAGHGRSGGRRGFIAAYEGLLSDANEFVDRLITDNEGSPIFLLGHSLGGALAALAARGRHHQLSGLIVSSPSIALMEPRWLQKLALSLSRVLPRLGVKPLDRSLLSTNSEVATAFDNDPLTYRRAIHVRTAAEIIRVGAAALHNARDVTLPLLVVQGTDDRITSAEAAAELYRLAASDDKSISLFKGMYHETFNEPGGRRVLENMADFILEHLPGRPGREAVSGDYG